MRHFGSGFFLHFGDGVGFGAGGPDDALALSGYETSFYRLVTCDSVICILNAGMIQHD